jgi:GLPGLI family protein
MISDSIVYANSNDQTGVDIQKASANLKGVRAGTTKVILRNLSTNVFTVSHSFGTTNYRYVDSVKLMKWIISTDTLTIATFQCTKASTLFRGRNYEAWFTTQVPLSIGPSLFRGLPGMIVKIKELKGNFEFTLVSLENLVPLKPIYLGKEKFTLVSRKEYRKNLDAFYNDFDAFMLSQGMSIKVRTPDGSPPPPQEKIVHNPMELE